MVNEMEDDVHVRRTRRVWLHSLASVLPQSKWPKLHANLSAMINPTCLYSTTTINDMYPGRARYISTYAILIKESYGIQIV
jgi:hypothetical protein